MIARGPTVNGDGDTPTGSVHIVGLPDSCAARAFAFDEPFPGWRIPGRAAAPVGQPARAHHVGAPGGPADGNRYLVLGLGVGQRADLHRAARPGGTDRLRAAAVRRRHRLAGHGSATPGTDPDTACAILTPGGYASIEVHRWQFGGRSRSIRDPAG